MFALLFVGILKSLVAILNLPLQFCDFGVGFAQERLRLSVNFLQAVDGGIDLLHFLLMLALD